MKSILQLFITMNFVVNVFSSLISATEINSPKEYKSFNINSEISSTSLTNAVFGNLIANPNPGSVSAIPDLILNGEFSYNYFGYSVAAAGDVNGDGNQDIIVGAPYYEVTFFGRAYIFYGGAGMNNVPDVIMTGESINSFFGYSVAGAGDVNDDGYSDVVIGAYGYANNVGRAYVYLGGSPMNNTADVILNGAFQSNNFGISVSSAGDVNGDGYDDVISGAEGYNNIGRVYLYYGGAVMNNGADLNFNGEAAGNIFGHAVSNAGDINNDGYSDILVGAPGYSSNTGRAYIYLGGASMNNVADVTMTGGGANYYFGSALDYAGSVNGDAYSDIIIGAYGIATNTGRAYIFFGGTGMDNISDVTLTGETTNNYFGGSVAFADDQNNDGYDDVIVGAEGHNAYTGKSYVYYGGSPMNNTADVTNTGEASNIYFGKSVACANDVNHDGMPDIIVGANNYSGAKGRAYIYYTPLPPGMLNVTAVVEGFYDNVINSMRLSDTVSLYLRYSNSPYSPVDSSRAVVNSISLSGSFVLTNAQSGIYYIELTHRNSIETWSNSPINYLRGSINSYDFTTASNKAYGNNLKQVDTAPGRYAFFSGDTDKDGFVELSDIVAISNDANSFVSGFVVTDLSGDGYVDLSDLTFAFNNSNDFVSVMKP